jgi:hypothetical protein
MDAAACSGASAVVNQLAQHGADLNAAAPMNEMKIGWIDLDRFGTIWGSMRYKRRILCLDPDWSQKH